MEPKINKRDITKYALAKLCQCKLHLRVQFSLRQIFFCCYLGLGKLKVVNFSPH